ncbi:MAG: hypothetical protein D6790_00850 [Caldilineae bacterium]|nr:MAG: hypothetical protein D6790_00850 [Caldilineae bacterium]
MKTDGKHITVHCQGRHVEATALSHGLTVMSTAGKAIATLMPTFDVDAMYVLDGGDQADWNKGGGIAPLITLDGMNNKVMLAWRWHPADQLFHVGIYWHPHGGGRVMPEDNGTLKKVAAGVPIIATFEAEWGRPYRASIVCPAGTADITCDGTRAPLLVRNVFSYFGGNRVAPRDMRYECERIYLSNSKIRIGI